MTYSIEDSNSHLSDLQCPLTPLGHERDNEICDCNLVTGLFSRDVTSIEINVDVSSRK